MNDDVRRLTLDWQGPWRLGTLPENPAEQADANVPGVYCYISSHLNGTVHGLYFGKAQGVLNRFVQHLGAVLSLTYNYRDEYGNWACPGAWGETRLTYLNNPVSRENAARYAQSLRFYHAPLVDEDMLTAPVEAVLIARAMAVCDETGPLRCDNHRREVFRGDIPLVIENRLPGDAAPLRAVLGDDPLHGLPDEAALAP